MKKILLFAVTIVMLLSMGFVADAQENVDLNNKIVTVEVKDGGYLIASGVDRGNALTVGEDAKQWRVKGHLGGKYAFIGEDGFAADVNGASTNEGVTIIQWTSTGANNQRWSVEEAEDGYVYIKSAFSKLYLTETDGVITQEAKNEEFNQLWKITVTGQFEPVVEKMLQSDAAKALSEYKYQRLYDFIMSGGEFNLLTYDKIEAMINERDYFNLSYEEQAAFIEECFTVEPTSLMYGSMATKLQRDIEVKFVGIEENVWQSWHGIPEEPARRYDVTITDKENGDSHTFKYYSTFDNDEEYAKTVGEAVACFEMPIAKTLHRFIYTSMNTSSWNGGDNTIWNNTGYRGDVNNMVQMFAHELGHVMDNGRQDNNVWYRAISQDIVPVTGYGKTNRWEDLAEYSRLYLLARMDEDRVAAIEKTYPARAKAYKGLLYAVDNEFYKDYKDEYEETLYAVGDYDKSVQVKISLEEKYLTDVNGELVLCEKKDAAASWQIWEVYTRTKGASVLRNKATGRYITLSNSVLSLGNATELGLKKVEGGFEIVDSSTGFVIDEKLVVSVEEGAVWTIEEIDSLAMAGDYKLQLQVSGEYLAYNADTGLYMDKEGAVFTLVPVEEGIFLVMEKETGKVFDISGGSIYEGASAILYSVTGGANQHFYLTNNGDGSYNLVVLHSNLNLTKTEDGFCQGMDMGYVKWVLEEVK